jgi:hypothetical protein
LGFSATAASVVSSSEATLAAFWSAERTTLVGSITPAANRSSYVSVAALKPFEPLADFTLSTTIGPSMPAFWAIQRSGSSTARRMMRTPAFWSSSSRPSSRPASAFCARRSATPPPATTPSSMAARVACRASSTRAFFSFISASVAAPTFTTATPPASLASRSWSFSRS